MRITSTKLELSGKSLQFTIFQTPDTLQVHIENLSTLRRIVTTLTPQIVQKITSKAGVTRNFEQFSQLVRKAVESPQTDELKLKLVFPSVFLTLNSSYENVTYQIDFSEVQRQDSDYYYIMYRNQVRENEALTSKIQQFQIDSAIKVCEKCDKLQRKLQRLERKLQQREYENLVLAEKLEMYQDQSQPFDAAEEF
ncbi:hypothetical protein SS50377_24941 [Spironucleus salmonicida]|uniref:Uncharacterized protein n=1 Tax=Spironucleus salmonicida TaxID=348837 RepID=V6LID3_9EUKA|nr:hypothetical protein SS50377_24941 [Spironucleus salmonicida]|eukprot:EST43471.1 Hypothetical protein SS50377_16837 [Spironucleus salmonicida]